MAVDPKIGYPILIISAISLILVLYTKSDQVNLLQKIEHIENDVAVSLKQSVANYKQVGQGVDSLNNITNAMGKNRALADARGNTTVGCILRVIADVDEDVELIKSKMNIPRESPLDKIHVDINKTAIVFRDGQNVTYTLPPVVNCLT